jgi:hypothetical protein
MWARPKPVMPAPKLPPTSLPTAVTTAPVPKTAQLVALPFILFTSWFYCFIDGGYYAGIADGIIENSGNVKPGTL